MRKVKDWLWDFLFLDFYLDPSWKLGFKILNLLSGDVIRPYLSSMMHYTNEVREDMSSRELWVRTKHVRNYTIRMWEYYRK